MLVLNWVHVSLLISKPDIGFCRCLLMMWAVIGSGGLAFCQAQMHQNSVLFTNTLTMYLCCHCACVYVYRIAYVSCALLQFCIVRTIQTSCSSGPLSSTSSSSSSIHPSLNGGEWDTRRSDTGLKLLMFI